MNIVFITLDSLRYDTLETAKTNNLDQIFSKHNTTWIKVWSQGTYTFTSHVALFHAGHLPCNNLENVPVSYTRKPKQPRMFKHALVWAPEIKGIYKIPSKAPNVIRGFSQLGYRTVGIGGVNWFNTNYPTSSIWKREYFDEFYWTEKFTPQEPNALENQIKLMKTLNLKNKKLPLLFFLNIPSTHLPCRGIKGLLGQIKALEYVDYHIVTILDLLPRPYHLFLFSDHGTCFGENGLVGHGFFHPKIMEVPMVIWKEYK